jgi:hypothetical protein
MQENLAKTTKKQSQNKAKTRQMSFGAKLFFMNNVFWQEFYCTQAQCFVRFVRSGAGCCWISLSGPCNFLPRKSMITKDLAVQ